MDHRCFRSYLIQFKRSDEHDNAYCRIRPNTAEHTIIDCDMKGQCILVRTTNNQRTL